MGVLPLQRMMMEDGNSKGTCSLGTGEGLWVAFEAWRAAGQAVGRAKGPRMAQQVCWGRSGSLCAWPDWDCPKPQWRLAKKDLGMSVSPVAPTETPGNPDPENPPHKTPP